MVFVAYAALFTQMAIYFKRLIFMFTFSVYGAVIVPVCVCNSFLTQTVSTFGMKWNFFCSLLGPNFWVHFVFQACKLNRTWNLVMIRCSLTNEVLIKVDDKLDDRFAYTGLNSFEYSNYFMLNVSFAFFG